MLPTDPQANRRQRRLARSARRPPLKIEALEPRLAMDGAGFVNSDPPEDPGSIVGVAGVVAKDDYLRTSAGTQTLRVSPLENDRLPEGATRLGIRSVSATQQGATVTISDDGRHLLYTAGAGGLKASDSFYYIVETENGELGKANVQILVRRPVTGGGGTPSVNSNDRFTVLEDAGEGRLDVLANDRQLTDPTVVAVSTTSRGGAVRIADDGSAVFYTPPFGQSGADVFTYTARGADGQELESVVRVNIEKPYQIISRPRSHAGSDNARLDVNASGVVLDPLANDRLRGPTDRPPRIDGFTAPGHAGVVELADDGRSFRYDPADGFQGVFSIRYTVRYGDAEHQTVDGLFTVSVLPQYLAAPNWFAVDPAAGGPTSLDVLGNDPLLRPYANLPQAHYLPAITRSVRLEIVGVSAGSAGGSIEVGGDGRTVLYRPADGFRGEETFIYTVEDSTGLRQTAEVTVHVADPISDPLLAGRFATDAEMRQFLIDRVVQRFAPLFGQRQSRFHPSHFAAAPGIAHAIDVTAFANSSVADADSHSETNTQVEGVDEADIVETDGRYLYTFAEGRLAIVDLEDPSSPRLISVSDFGGAYDKMYLQGDRIILLQSGTRWRSPAEVLVLDLGDRTAPSVVERTEIEGRIVDSRAIGDRVHLVVHKNFDSPALLGGWVTNEPEPGAAGAWRNETLTEYLDRVGDELFTTGLPTFKTFDGAGGLVASGLLSSPTDIHRPINGDDLAVAFVTIDAGDAEPGPLGGATTFIADDRATVYLSADTAYIFSYDAATDTTTLHKLALNADGDAPLAATGAFRGRLLNQFAADEHDGLLRVATTQQERETLANGRSRQTRVFNNLLVLEQRGAELAVVGEIANLAPTETIHAVRYQGDRAFVVTFRVVDPLFAIDLSDPTEPTVEGALKIPGFSNYLHPVGEDHLIGVGRDADEVTGRLGPLQVTLFDVADLSNPTVADQLTFEGARWVNSEAWTDHHAVSFFATGEGGEGVLALPIAWTESETTGGGWYGAPRRAGLFTIAVSTGGGGSLVATGRIEHDAAPGGPAGPPHLGGEVDFGGSLLTTATDFWRLPLQRETGSDIRRAVRVGESLVSVSANWVEVHNLANPDEQLGRVFLGRPAIGDSFSIQEDSGPQSLDVLANDVPPDGGPLSVAAVTQPATGGVVAIAADGDSLVFTPEEDFFGSVTFTYTLNTPVWGEVEATVTVWVQNTPDAPIAVDDETAVGVGSGATAIDVLANDIDPDQRPTLWSPGYVIDTIASPAVFTNRGLVDAVRTQPITSPAWRVQGLSSLKITEVGPTDQGGTVAIDTSGRLLYQPAAGFEGIETFTYTVENLSGLTDVGTVTVVVGQPPLPAAAEPEAASDPTPAVGGLLPPPWPAPLVASRPESLSAESGPQAAERLPAAPAGDDLLLLLRSSATEIDEAIAAAATRNSEDSHEADEEAITDTAAESLVVLEAALAAF